MSPRTSLKRPHVASVPDADGRPIGATETLDGLTLGARLRATRNRHHLSLRDVADRSGLSRAFINQVELGRVSPSFASLSRIAEALGESLVELFQPPSTRTEGVVRASDSVRMELPDGGYVDEILTPSLAGRLLILRSTIQPGVDSGPAYRHDAEEECVTVLEGRLEVTVDEDRHDLGPGDALTFKSLRPHAWRNAGDVVVVALWAITPPRY
ncbi:MAG: XRE family transcriptional regulator [Chloroflexota bacterium]